MACFTERTGSHRVRMVKIRQSAIAIGVVVVVVTSTVDGCVVPGRVIAVNLVELLGSFLILDLLILTENQSGQSDQHQQALRKHF